MNKTINSPRDGQARQALFDAYLRIRGTCTSAVVDGESLCLRSVTSGPARYARTTEHDATDAVASGRAHWITLRGKNGNGVHVLIDAQGRIQQGLSPDQHGKTLSEAFKDDRPATPDRGRRDERIVIVTSNNLLYGIAQALSGADGDRLSPEEIAQQVTSYAARINSAHGGRPALDRFAKSFGVSTEGKNDSGVYDAIEDTLTDELRKTPPEELADRYMTKYWQAVDRGEAADARVELGQVRDRKYMPVPKPGTTRTEPGNTPKQPETAVTPGPKPKAQFPPDPVPNTEERRKRTKEFLKNDPFSKGDGSTDSFDDDDLSESGYSEPTGEQALEDLFGPSKKPPEPEGPNKPDETEAQEYQFQGEFAPDEHENPVKPEPKAQKAPEPKAPAPEPAKQKPEPPEPEPEPEKPKDSIAPESAPETEKPEGEETKPDVDPDIAKMFENDLPVHKNSDGRYVGEGYLSVKDLHMAPKRFQYKVSEVDKSRGTTNELDSQNSFDRNLGGSLLVWHDTKDGKFYVVNGHHRYELARRTNYQGKVHVRMIDARNDVWARSEGARINIAEGHGTVYDAAMYIRDAENPMVARKIVENLPGKIADAAVYLSKLNHNVWAKYQSGRITEKQAELTGKYITDMHEQNEFIDGVEFEQKKKFAMVKDIPSSVFETLAKYFAEGNSIVRSEGKTLFGDEDTVHDFMIRAELASEIGRQLREGKNFLTSASKGKNVKRLEDTGNKTNKEQLDEGRELARKYSGYFDIFKTDRVKREIYDLIAKWTQDFYKCKTDTKKKEFVYERLPEVQEALKKIIEREEGQNSNGAGTKSGSEREAGGTAARGDDVVRVSPEKASYSRGLRENRAPESGRLGDSGSQSYGRIERLARRGMGTGTGGGAISGGDQGTNQAERVEAFLRRLNGPLKYGHWITIGGQKSELADKLNPHKKPKVEEPEKEEDEKEGVGTHVYIEDGRITKGPPALEGLTLSELCSKGKGTGSGQKRQRWPSKNKSGERSEPQPERTPPERAKLPEPPAPKRGVGRRANKGSTLEPAANIPTPAPVPEPVSPKKTRTQKAKAPVTPIPPIPETAPGQEPTPQPEPAPEPAPEPDETQEPTPPESTPEVTPKIPEPEPQPEQLSEKAPEPDVIPQAEPVPVKAPKRKRPPEFLDAPSTPKAKKIRKKYLAQLDGMIDYIGARLDTFGDNGRNINEFFLNEMNTLRNSDDPDDWLYAKDSFQSWTKEIQSHKAKHPEDAGEQAEPEPEVSPEPEQPAPPNPAPPREPTPEQQQQPESETNNSGLTGTPEEIRAAETLRERYRDTISQAIQDFKVLAREARSQEEHDTNAHRARALTRLRDSGNAAMWINNEKALQRVKKWCDKMHINATPKSTSTKPNRPYRTEDYFEHVKDKNGNDTLRPRQRPIWLERKNEPYDGKFAGEFQQNRSGMTEISEASSAARERKLADLERKIADAENNGFTDDVGKSEDELDQPVTQYPPGAEETQDWINMLRGLHALVARSSDNWHNVNARKDANDLIASFLSGKLSTAPPKKKTGARLQSDPRSEDEIKSAVEGHKARIFNEMKERAGEFGEKVPRANASQEARDAFLQKISELVENSENGAGRKPRVARETKPPKVQRAPQVATRGSKPAGEKPEADKPEEPPVKRGRGRPRKEVAPPDPNTPDPVKRGRGRPRKEPVSTPEQAPQVKRGRGRPKKVVKMGRRYMTSSEAWSYVLEHRRANTSPDVARLWVR